MSNFSGNVELRQSVHQGSEVRVLAISSGGGHWVELLRLLPAIQQHEITFASVHQDYQRDVPGREFFVIRDATRWDRWGLIVLAVQVAVLILRRRPQVVITTGAAPGFFGVLFGTVVRAKTIWVDSLANVDELSRSGAMAGKIVGLWLTQWPDLARTEGPEYSGQVI